MLTVKVEKVQTIDPAQLHPIKVTGPWDMVGMDLIGPLSSKFIYSNMIYYHLGYNIYHLYIKCDILIINLYYIIN